MTTDFRGTPHTTDFTNHSEVNTGVEGFHGEVGGGWFIEDRADAPFVSEKDPADALLQDQERDKGLSFGDREYWAKWWAVLALHDFVATPWRDAADDAMDKGQGVENGGRCPDE
jgi:hypothetical protein